MKKFSFLFKLFILLGFGFSAVSTQANDIGDSYIKIEKEINKSFEGIMEIRCKGFIFDINCTGNATDVTTFEAVINGEFKSFMHKGDFDIDVICKKEGNILHIEVETPQGVSSRNAVCRMEINTSSKTNLVISNVSGNIKVNNFDTHKVHIKSTSGDLTIDQIKTKTDPQFSSTSGNIHGENFSCPTLHARSTSGDLFITEIKGNAELKSTSGNVNSDNISGDAKLSSTSGNVTANNISGTLEAKSTSGNVKISKVAKNSILSSTSGDIHAFHLNGHTKARSVSGMVEIKDSKGQFELRTTSADIKATGLRLTGPSNFNSNNGDITCRLKNTEDEITFNLLSTSGSLEVDHKSAKRKLYTGNGDILIKGKTTSGDQTYIFL